MNEKERGVMSRRRKIVIAIIIAVVVTPPILYWLFPREIIGLLALEKFWFKRAPDWEKRRLAHRTIRRYHEDHDCFLLLIDYGNKQSVPILIEALASDEAKPAIAASADGSILCTWGHCIDALRSLTGEDFSVDHEAWKRWWESEGIALPDEHFYPRKVESVQPGNQH